MESASGMIYLDGGFREGHVVVEGGIARPGTGPLENAEVTGIIIPGMVNCHTHLGDAFVGAPPPDMSVEDLVGPPDSLKHRMLAAVSEREQVEAMKGALDHMFGSGIGAFVDFREGGLEGVRRLLEASAMHGACPVPVVLGRPLGPMDDVEMDALLEVADGVGASGISDMDYGALEWMSERARRRGRIFALHASENRREDIGEILDLKPDMLVHMVMASDGDMEACAEAGVPVAVCPSANSYFGLEPPVRRMLDAGITVCLGTDNAMLSAPDLLGGMRALRDMGAAPEPEEIVGIALSAGRKVLNSLPGLGRSLGCPGFFVLEGPADDPYARLMDASASMLRPVM